MVCDKAGGRLKAVTYAIFEKDYHVHWTDAFAKGLARHGFEVARSEYRPQHVIDADLHIFWGLHAHEVVQHCREHGQPFICLDCGYTEDRMTFTSLNLNGLNGLSELDVSSFLQDTSRCQMHGWQIKERETAGDSIFIAGQVYGDRALNGIDIYEWASATIAKIRALGFDGEILFKPHPKEEQKNIKDIGVPLFNGDIDEAYEQAKIFLTYSSTTACFAWLNGVPALADSPGSMIYTEQFDADCLENRQNWLNGISFRQYNAEEMSSGLAWEIMSRFILGKAPRNPIQQDEHTHHAQLTAKLKSILHPECAQ